MPYVAECKRLRVYTTAVPGSAVLKQKQEALTQPLLQKIMSVFNTCDFENSLLMEENQHYLLTQQHVSILISDEKLMVPMSSKQTPDFSFTCHVSCITSASVSSLYQLGKESKINETLCK